MKVMAFTCEGGNNEEQKSKTRLISKLYDEHKRVKLYRVH